MEKADSLSSCTDGDQEEEDKDRDRDRDRDRDKDTDKDTEDRDRDSCGNPTRDALAEGLLSLIKPQVDLLDDRLAATRLSQIELEQVVESLTEELNKVKNLQVDNSEFEEYIKKLANCKRKITVISTLLQNTQERLEKIYPLAETEHKRRKALLNIDNPEASSSETSNISNENQ